MANKKSKKIELANCNSIRFPVVDKVEHDMLIIGNFDGIFGNFIKAPNGKLDFNASAGDALMVNGKAVIRTIQSKKHIYLLSTKETAKYFMDFLTICRDKGFFDSVGRSGAITKYFHFSVIDLWKDDNQIIDCVKNNLFNNLNNMKFDSIIQNPPYNGSLHLDFLEKGLDLLTEKGRMVIIEPATWLINVRKNGKAKKYDAIKKRIEGHVESVKIENYNKEFNILNNAPFAITTIDMGKTYDSIVFTCGGEHKIVKSIYDCNHVGDYETIWSIIHKVQSHSDMMSSHTTVNTIDGAAYMKYCEILINPIVRAAQNIKYMEEDTIYMKSSFGDYASCYTMVMTHNRDNDILSVIPLSRAIGGGNTTKLSDKNANCVYGTKEELENWKYFTYNNKLPLFLNIVLTIDQHNNSKEFLPWLVDKQYTDEEINKMFGFTDEEIALIDRTIKKYERNSPWFKRYMCGPDSVSDKEVTNFIKSLGE